MSGNWGHPGSWAWPSPGFGAVLRGIKFSLYFSRASFRPSLSFGDFIIAYFVAGPNVTLPIYVFSSIRRGITPEINAIGTVVLLTSLLLLVLAQVILQRGNRTTKIR